MQKLNIIYEDNHLIAVNKPSGLLVQGDRTGDICLLDLTKEFLKETYNKPGNIFCGCIHRIDRPVSGCVLMAKTSKALERMNKIFSQREVQKTYWALVHKKPINLKGILTHYIIKNEQQNKVKAYDSARPNALEALLEYELIKQVNKGYILEVKPYTGRPHQIRSQLAAMGCPIVGDVKYGSPAPLPDAVIGLHSKELRFVHPVKNESVYIDAAVPRIFL
ncbi:MAG: RluA family pseudouridine synthase [Bacteroidota bacterium]|nr:RluA family pseudouridine synthase [Bacteroidota bacterium]